MENQDPQIQPGDPAPDTGTSTESQPQPQPTAADDTAARLAQIEERNKELERRLTQQGRELARAKQVPSQAPQQPEPIDPNAYFSDPAGQTRRVVTDALTEYERRQDEKRQTERMMERAASRYGMTVDQMQEYHQRLVDAATDPDAYMGILAGVFKADHVDTAVDAARKAALEQAKLNGRAITSEGDATRTSPVGKAYEDMTTDELEAHIRKTMGVGEFR